jgi:hypothetical protein
MAIQDACDPLRSVSIGLTVAAGIWVIPRVK